MKQLIFASIFLMVSCAVKSQSKAEEVCNALNKYFSEVEKEGQLSNIKGSLFAPAQMGGRIAQEFNSLEKFPLSQLTTIVDSSKLAGNPYRKIKALMLRETRDSATLSASMQKIFSAFDIAFRNCLLPQKYSYTGPGQQTIKLHKVESTLSRTLERVPGRRSVGLFDQTLYATIYVEQTQKDGKYIHELYIALSRG